MLKRILRFDYLLPLILLTGVAQYSFVAYSAIMSGNVSNWTVDSSELTSAGLLRYIKDAMIVGVAIAWLFLLPTLRLPREIIRLIHSYFLWLASVISIGLIGFILGYSPLFFLPAGLRWILLLHAAFGVFILSSTLVIDKTRHKFIFRFLLAIVLVNGYATLLQFKAISSAFDLALGASRLTGLFSNAAVAGYFALAIALLIGQLDGIRLKNRIAATFLCLFLALSSGTRLATGAVFLILLSQFWEMMGTSGKGFKTNRKIVFFPLALIAIFIGYQALISQVDRGGAISQQFDEGGRAANFLVSINILTSANIGELFFGRGLGIGTNTAITALLANGVDPNQYRFNTLIDNSLLTSMFQFGLFGSLVFWFGIWKFITITKPKYSSLVRPRYLVTVTVILMTVVLGNPFEQYFLMMAFASVLGAVYWSDRIAFQKIQVGQS
jgi:hypothetical protein